MKFTIIPCRYQLDEFKRLISITPMIGGAFPSNHKLAWVKDFYSHQSGNPRKLKECSTKKVSEGECPGYLADKTYGELLTEALPINSRLYQYDLNKGFFIVSLNTQSETH